MIENCNQPDTIAQNPDFSVVRSPLEIDCDPNSPTFSEKSGSYTPPYLIPHIWRSLSLALGLV
ncbi:hypothetical protein K9N68_16385 [Kovacikia minuta CCNUW1]|uniref:hypothetical protein n=1 Tax=Kovacikia minuta TaxID=2931930 RepID=UPI001CCCE6F2|nr:hypothetical protein [Kovacikia minuta]UBF29268.1 hypothetical protein K9N68_16385 [Kovacikia minuta CCNUW1]